LFFVLMFTANFCPTSYYPRVILIFIVYLIQ